MSLVVREVGPGAVDVWEGRVLAAGGGWAWLRTRRGPVHLTGERGPLTPVTARVGRVPALAPADRVRLDPSRARVWRTEPPPQPAPEAMIRDACAAVRVHLWNDPRALSLGATPFDESVQALAGRGPGLTPAGDDVLLGWMLARRAVAHPSWRHEAAAILRAARSTTTTPSRALLLWGSRGQAPEVAAAALSALLAADGAALAPAVRGLRGFGRTTGPAILTGLVVALTAGGQAPPNR